MAMFFDISGFPNKGFDFLAQNPMLQPYAKEIVSLEKASPGMCVNRLLVYYALLVDRKSPLLNIDNLRERKSEAAKMAHLIKRGNKYPEWVQEIIVGSDYVNRVKNRMLYVQHNNTWSLLVSLQDAYYKILEDIGAGDSTKAKEAIKLKTDIDGLIEEMNQGPLSMEDKEMVYSILEEQSLGIRPEEYIPKYQKDRRVFIEFAQ